MNQQRVSLVAVLAVQLFLVSAAVAAPAYGSSRCSTRPAAIRAD
jgi:hypothetical protein